MISKKVRNFLLMAVLISRVGFSAEGRESGRIGTPEIVQSKLDLKYWLAKNVVLDIDEFLIQQGIEADSCVYQSYLTQKKVSASGLGKCLYENFKESMRSDSLSGVTFFWLKGLPTEASPFVVKWRPPVGGFKKILRQIFEMKFEQPLYWLRSYTEPKTAQDLHYSEFLGGSWDIIIPSDEESLRVLKKTRIYVIDQFLGRIKEVQFSLQPAERIDGVVVHKGELKAEVRSDLSNFDRTVRFGIQTNINLLITDRPFYLKVKSEINTDGNSIQEEFEESNER